MRNTARTRNTHEIKNRIETIYTQIQLAAPLEYFELLEEGLTLKRQLLEAPSCICNECMAGCDELDLDP